MANKSPSKSANIPDVLVIGGGPAGLMAAGIAAKNGAKVILVEKNEIMGKKLLISGGGRCNMTNAEPDERVLLSKFGKKGNFLFSPFSMFDNNDAIRFFEKLGVKTKVENNFRVFPVSDKSADVLGALVKAAQDYKVEFKLGVGVAHIKKIKNRIESVILENGEELKAKSFMLATGGKSHPETGSTGDGFTLAHRDRAHSFASESIPRADTDERKMGQRSRGNYSLAMSAYRFGTMARKLFPKLAVCFLPTTDFPDRRSSI